MIRRPPRSTRTTHSFPTRRSSDLHRLAHALAQLDAGLGLLQARVGLEVDLPELLRRRQGRRSEEHTSELQSLMRISYAVFCLKKKKKKKKMYKIPTP